LGFYQTGQFKTFSKIEAIELESRTGTKSLWNFNDEVFTKFNWTEEPKVDLWELYKLRARQIRSKYDYVVLWYSGGSDSHNMLCSWIEADCKIDEIAVTWNYEGSKDKQSFCNAEITNVVLPHVDSLRKQGYNFKFRLIDISQLSLDVITDMSFNIEYFANRHFSVNNIARSLLRERINDYQTMIDSGKRVGFVWGIEKPHVFYDGNKHYFQFRESFDGYISPYVQNKSNKGWYDELFYWSPDMPLIPIKGAHVIKNFVETCKDDQFYQTGRNFHGFNPELKKYLTLDAVKILLYPKWNRNIFCNGKASSVLFSDRDAWFIKSNLAESHNYEQMIYSVVKRVGSKWYTNRNFSYHESIKYYLE